MTGNDHSNLNLAFFATRRCFDGRVEQIVNVSSATVMSGSPIWLHYISSKGAIIAMTRALARELGDDRITVNAVAPGFALTQASLGLVENAAVRRDARRAEAGRSRRRYGRSRIFSCLSAGILHHRPKR